MEPDVDGGRGLAATAKRREPLAQMRNLDLADELGVERKQKKAPILFHHHDHDRV